MASVSELTYDIPIEFPIVKRYIPIRVIRGDDVTLRFTQPSGEDWITPQYNITIYDEVTRQTLGSTPFNNTTTVLTINNYNFDARKALVVLEDRQGNNTAATGTMTFSVGASVSGNITITYGGNSVTVPVLLGDSTSAVATKIATAVNADTTIQITANATGANVVFTAKVIGTSENANTILFSDTDSTGVVANNPTLSGGQDYTIKTYKTVGHLNFVVFDGGTTKLTNLGFVEITLEDDSTATVPYFQTGFEVN